MPVTNSILTLAIRIIIGAFIGAAAGVALSFLLVMVFAAFPSAAMVIMAASILLGTGAGIGIAVVATLRPGEESNGFEVEPANGKSRVGEGHD